MSRSFKWFYLRVPRRSTSYGTGSWMFFKVHKRCPSEQHTCIWKTRRVSSKTASQLLFPQTTECFGARWFFPPVDHTRPPVPRKSLRLRFKLFVVIPGGKLGFQQRVHFNLFISYLLSTRVYGNFFKFSSSRASETYFRVASALFHSNLRCVAFWRKVECN